MALETSSVSFPANPVVNQTYEFDGHTWQWNGIAWYQVAHPTLQGRQRMDWAKAWAYITVSSGVHTLVAGYNISSVTKNGTGDITVNLSTPFNSVKWVPLFSINTAQVSPGDQHYQGVATNSVEIQYYDNSVLTDPASWSFVGFGDQ